MKFRWTAFFFLILVLTQGSSIVDLSSNPSFLGFPKWLYFFVVVHVLFVIALYYYSQSADKIEEE